jgi:hypothetical protein
VIGDVSGFVGVNASVSLEILDGCSQPHTSSLELATDLFQAPRFLTRLTLRQCAS